jgi:RHS repeat-associated protein
VVNPRLVDEIEYDPYGNARRTAQGDFNHDGYITTQDIYDLVGAEIGQHPAADTNEDGGVGVSDITDHLEEFFAADPTPRDRISNSIIDNPYGYCGYYADTETAAAKLLGPSGTSSATGAELFGAGCLYHVRHRVYDPMAGRWLTRDPAGFVDGMSLYEYCGGMATTCFDPAGLDACGTSYSGGPGGSGGGGAPSNDAGFFSQLGSLYVDGAKELWDMLWGNSAAEDQAWGESMDRAHTSCVQTWMSRGLPVSEARKNCGALNATSVMSALADTRMDELKRLESTARGIAVAPLALLGGGLIFNAASMATFGVGYEVAHSLYDGKTPTWSGLGGAAVDGALEGSLGWGIGKVFGKAFAKVRLWALDRRLAKHLSNALDEFNVTGLTPRQAAAASRRPSMRRMFEGDRIDTIFKRMVTNDKKLSSLKITPRGKTGPDVYDPASGHWWDVTTHRDWLRHVKKYGPGGRPLTY